MKIQLQKQKCNPITQQQSVQFDIIYLTYHIENLKFSLRALQDINYQFNLIIHNDNPKIKLTKSWLLENCELNKIKYNELTIINEDTNVGMLFSRIKAFRSVQNSKYTLFMDDDDYLYIQDLPKFDEYNWYRYNIIVYPTSEKIQKIIQNKETIDLNESLVNFNICASFWKSDLLNKAFQYIEKYKPEYTINSLEDFIIQQITEIICLRDSQYYLKHLEKVGLLYVKSDVDNKYSHIDDSRYNPNYEGDYKEYVHKYCLDLRTKIMVES